MKRIWVYWIILMVHGCGTLQPNPKTMKSPLSYLHGKHYERGPVTLNGMNFPIGFQTMTFLQGRLQFSDQESSRILEKAKIRLLDERGNEIAEAETDEKGNFQFYLDMEHGRYQLVLENDHWRAKEEVLVDQYEIRHIELMAIPKDQKKEF